MELNVGNDVLFSPFEHPVERIALSNFNCHSMIVDDEFFRLKSTEHTKLIQEWFDKKLEQLSPKGVIFVISEVSYCTGQEISLKPIIDSLRATARSKDVDIKFIIDGAHAVGNLKGDRPIDLADGYVFCGHKWLMSPEPSGFVITTNTMHWYDAWLSQIPPSSVSATALCSILASLEFLSSLDNKEIGIRLQNLKKFAKDVLLNNAFQIIGNYGLKNSNMFCLEPKSRYEWCVPLNDLSSELERSNCFLDVPEYYNNGTKYFRPWVRIAMSFFLDWKAVNDLSVQLRSAVRQSR